jgi:hypothetical protein
MASSASSIASASGEGRHPPGRRGARSVAPPAVATPAVAKPAFGMSAFATS